MANNLLYYGDNLDVMRRHVADESVDLVYLDPPFNSNAAYNVLFAEQSGNRAAAQIKAFDDTWRWDEASARAYEETVEAGGKVAQVMLAFRTFLGGTNLLAYLSMMAPRLAEMRRVMRPTASIYLHCDPTASHYLKLLMDAAFGPENFRNEITWKRTYAHGAAKRYGPVHDVILFYAKTESYLWRGLRTEPDPAYIDKHFRYVDEMTGNKFQAISLTGSGVRHGDSGKPWRDVNPTKVGRHWALPGKILAGLRIENVTLHDALDALDRAGRIYWPKKEDGTPRLKWYADDMEGAALPDMWTDIGPISAQAKERLGYPTQKPVALLERILQASSNPGDTVLDPFCGCGTTVHAAQKLDRRWVGIDITSLAISLIKSRLLDAFGREVLAQYQVIGEPVAVEDAARLAAEDPYQFQWWALGLVGARPVEGKKGADKGIDGRLYFHDDSSGKTKQVIFSVKAGHTGPTHVRDLHGVIDREKAEIGVLISMQDPTGPMRHEAASGGFYHSPGWNHDYPRVQVITVGELLSGKSVQMPPIGQVNRTFKRAAREAGPQAVAVPLDLGD